MKSVFKLMAAAAFAISAPLAASATTVPFDFGSHGDVTANQGNSVTAVSGGISLTVTGGAFSGGLNGHGYWADATAWSNGIGLRSDQFNQHDAHFVDGYYDEYLLLTFDTAVDLTSLTFSYANFGDDWQVLSGNFAHNTFQDSGHLSGWRSGGSSLQTAMVDSHVIGTQFLIGTTGNHSEWKLNGLSVHVAPVPLPASGLLLLAGMGGIAAIRRRRRAAD